MSATVVVCNCDGTSCEHEGRCGREQAIEVGDGVGRYVVTDVDEEAREFLESCGWRRLSGTQWRCPFCAPLVGFGPWKPVPS